MDNYIYNEESQDFLDLMSSRNLLSMLGWSKKCDNGLQMWCSMLLHVSVGWMHFGAQKEGWNMY